MIVNQSNTVSSYSAEDIERIIDSFYSPTSSLSSVQRQELNKVLENLQYSSSAWTFSWKLLDTTKSASVQFFGAVALCNKICKNLSELDENQIQQLFQQLTHYLIFHASINYKQITTKLAIGLSHLILHMAPDKWDNGLTSIIALFTQSRNEFLIQHPERGHLIALNMLTLLPEEFSRLTVSKSRRSSIRLELDKEFSTVLNYLQFIISSYSQPEILSKVFTCLAKWLEFGISVLKVEPFFDYLFNSLMNENLFNDVSECLSVIFTSPDALKYPTTFARLLPYVLQLETLLDQCITVGNKEKAESITKLITQFGENLPQLIVQNAQSHNFCRLIMKCTCMNGQYPIDETCSELTFNFWHALKEEIASSEENNTSLELFRPYFEHLIEILITKGQLPENEDVFSSEDKDVFRTYRTSIADTMMSMYDILHIRAMEILGNHLLISVEQSQSWQRQESIVYLIGAGSEYMQAEDNPVLPHIFSLISKLNFCNNRIINTTLAVLGQYSSWLGTHPDILQNCVHLCFNALSNRDLIQSASIALKELIKENRLYISKYLNDIFPIMKDVLESVHVQSDDRIRCVCIIGYILSAHPSKTVLEYFKILLVPEVNKLIKYLSETGDHQKENICITLNFISVLITSFGYYGNQVDEENMTNITEVLCCILRDLDSIFQMILKQYGDDVQITEKICEILSRSVTILRESSSLVLNTFLQLLQSMGPNILHSEFLNFVRNTLLLFSNNADSSVHPLFLAVTQKFGCLFNEEWLRNHVDTVEDVANFFAQIIKKLPAVVHHCPDEAFVLFIQFMKHGIQMHEQGVSRSISTLASNFIEYTKSNQRAAELLQQHGLEFVRILLQCIGTTSPRHLIESLFLPLFTLSKTYIQWATQWVQQCLNDPNFPSSSAKRHHREALLKILSSERTSRSSFKDHINIFASACREPTLNDNLS
ncbi:unnamed protein product [Adineta ricciae]|uniref:Importin-13 n=1 Tax=Adineta ricciae TaxID=249248 RepID=A0A813QNH1_ADIRI|nr:unnamed protein product [Adineta ricciae]CAF0770718.1 unnamed protein product [Adineta ricciae]